MLKLVIDMGTSVTKIYKKGGGVVLSEPSCVAINAETQKVEAVGTEAKRFAGRTDIASVVYPVFEGEVLNEKTAAAMLDAFLNKIGVKSRSRAEFLFSVPCGATEKAKAALYEVCAELGISRVAFAESPYLAALAHGVLTDDTPVFVMDIGAGTSDIAALSSDGAIAGLSVNVGGGNMDAHIADHIADAFGLKINAATSERLKNAAGSLLPGDEKNTVVNGRDEETDAPRSVTVSSVDILYPIQVYVDKILEYATVLLKKLPMEVLESIRKNGVLLSGGICEIAGMADYIGDKLCLPVRVFDAPQLAVAVGGGKALDDVAFLKKIKQDF